MHCNFQFYFILHEYYMEPHHALALFVTFDSVLYTFEHYESNENIYLNKSLLVYVILTNNKNLLVNFLYCKS